MISQPQGTPLPDETRQKMTQAEHKSYARGFADGIEAAAKVLEAALADSIEGHGYASTQTQIERIRALRPGPK